MKKKALILGLVIIVIIFGVILTVCSLDFNFDSDEKEISSSKKNRRKEKIALEDYDNCYYDDGYYNCKIGCSSIDLGDEFYYVIYGNDDSGNATWAYETEKTDYYRYVDTEYLGDYNEEIVYILDNGKLVALDAENGEELWDLEDEYITNSSYNFREDGILDLVFGENSKILISIDTYGNILKRIDFSEYSSELNDIHWLISFEDEELSLLAESDIDYCEVMKIKVNLNNYKVKAKKIEHSEVTEDMLVGKTLYSEWNESYYFDEDGNVDIISNNNYIDKYSVIRFSGTWNLEYGMLNIKVTEATIAYDGHYEYDEEENRILVDYNEKTVSANKEEQYELIYYPDYDGEEYIECNGIFYEILEPVG